LVWELGGYSLILRKNAIISKALHVRGYNTHTVICDGSATACMQREIEKSQRLSEWSHACSPCREAMAQMANGYDVSYSFSSQYLTKQEKHNCYQLSQSVPFKEILSYRFHDISVGLYAWSSFNRYLKGSLRDPSQLDENLVQVYRQYFYASLVNTLVAVHAIETYRPISVLTSHGVYVDYAPVMAQAFRKGIPAISWVSGYFDFHHYFTVAKQSDKFLLWGVDDSTWKTKISEGMTEIENARLDVFFNERYFGNKSRDLQDLPPPDSKADLKRKLNIHDDRPVVCLFAHINWDAGLDMSGMIFSTANDWVLASIKQMIELKDVHWLIRVHPSEKKDGIVFGTADVIRSEFSDLPDHIHILGPDFHINPMGLYGLITAGITMFGTVGVELACLGIPMIIAGEAHYSGKGFTHEATTRDDYNRLLREAKSMPRLTEKQKQLARLYAHFFFFERQIPINIIRKEEGHWGNVDVQRIEELLPGKDPVLDLICNSIVHGRDFVLSRDLLNRIKPVKLPQSSHAS
jgi:hypothetical protein